jgi:hypothetical protein
MRIFGLDIQRAGDLRGAEVAASTRERLHRLEIAHSEMVDHFNKLQARVAKVTGKVYGDTGGRPASHQGTLPLDRVPHGDKAALRRALGVVPGSRFNHQE